MKHFPELQLTPISARVLGCLLEKQAQTPDLYPLTLNSLVAACNQSTSRHPVTSYTPQELEQALRSLSEDYLVTKVMGGRAPKFEHCLEDVLHLTDAERAIFTVLLLRGSQTPGELRQRTERMHVFNGLDEVEEILNSFIEYPHGPLVERMPAGGGRRVETFRHLLCADSGSQDDGGELPASNDWQEMMENRVAALEAELAGLKSRLGEN